MEPSNTGQKQQIVRVGIIGCGEVTQVAHIPNFLYLSHLFRITYLCDVSPAALKHCVRKIPQHHHVSTTRDAHVLCGDRSVDVVFIASADAFHLDHVLLGLNYGKFVFVEKPMVLSLRDADEIIRAEELSEFEGRKGRVMVGYMRRYAAAFVDAVKEIGDRDEILYARVRDIVGQNSTFVGQSGTFSRKFGDISDDDAEDLKVRTDEVLEQALGRELGIGREQVAEDMKVMWRHLGSLGSHDLSAMREALGGMPVGVRGASLCSGSGPPFWSAILQYPKFTVSYESGIDHVPRFDASIEIFTKYKTIKVCFDSPYVKGLPTTMHIKEAAGEDRNTFKETVVRRTYEDPYTLEMKELYACFVQGKEIKTTAKDARKEVEIFGMIMKAGLD